MAEITIDMTVDCEKCGSRLKATGGNYSNGTAYVDAEPCKTCLEEAREEGYQDGYSTGANESAD